MRIFGILAVAALVVGLACPAFAADLGIGKSDFFKRFNAHASQAGLPALPSKPMQENKQQDKNGPITISVHPIGTLVIMLQTYDSKPGTIASLALINQIGGPPANDAATTIAIDSLFAALAPKMQTQERNAAKKALGLEKGLKGAILDGKRREHVASGIRFVAGAQQGKGITFAAYPAKR